MNKTKPNGIRLRRALKAVQVLRGVDLEALEDLLHRSVERPAPQLAASRKTKGIRKCTRQEFVRVAATFARPFTQEQIAEALKRNGLSYRHAKTPIDAIRTRLNKDPMFKTHKTNSTIPRAHFILDRRIAKLLLA